MKYKRLAALLTLIFLLTPVCTPHARAAEPAETWVVSLPDGLVVENGECVSYTTIAAGMLPEPVDGFYPGGLTIELGGQIVVKSGGSLAIGKLSIGSAEPSPVLRGALREGGLIRVEAGGSLTLNGVTLELAGEEGYVLWQENGSAVEIYDTELVGNVKWGAPVVDNTYTWETDLWLEAGTPLTEALLPTEKAVSLLKEGVPQPVTLPVRWTLPEDGAADELTLTGVYLDENGEALLSVVPLTLTVHWYTPEEIIITDTAWFEDAGPLAGLYVNILPEDAEMWAEYSEDGGDSWTRLEIWDMDEDTLCCIIAPPDSAPRLYRLAAENWDSTQHWVSGGILLPGEDTVSEDISGNRGGSTDPAPPDREPTPPVDVSPSDPEPAPPQTAGEEGQDAPNAGLPGTQPPDAASADGEPDPAPPVQENAPVESTAEPKDDTPDVTPPAREDVSAGEPAPPENKEPDAALLAQGDASIASPAASKPLPTALQIVLAAAGLAACVLAGGGIAHILFRKRK